MARRNIAEESDSGGPATGAGRADDKNHDGGEIL
jgi:hypothetical protein